MYYYNDENIQWDIASYCKSEGLNMDYLMFSIKKNSKKRKPSSILLVLLNTFGVKQINESSAIKGNQIEGE